MARLSPADLWGLELIKKWKSLGNKNTPRLYKDTVFWLSRGFVGWAADKNKQPTLFGEGKSIHIETNRDDTMIKVVFGSHCMTKRLSTLSEVFKVQLFLSWQKSTTIKWVIYTTPTF